MAKVNRAVSLGAVSLVAIAIILVAGFGLFLDINGINTTTASSSSSAETNSVSTSQEFTGNGPCLLNVQNATIINFQNSSFIGYKVSMLNGTISYFPLGGCPSPVSPKLFTVATEIERMPSFIAAEKNHTYVVDPIGSLNSGGTVMTSGYVSSFTVISFGYYTDQRISPCGGSFWTLLQPGGIQVDLPINPDGSYNLSKITIESQFSTSGVETFLCTTQVTMTNITTITSSNTSSSTICTILGQPGPFFLRVLSNYTSTPLVGAQVMATNQPALCNNSPATKQTTTTFTTNGAEWYSLASDNNAGYSFIVSYSGKNYTFTASLRPVSVTCATLYIPSGRTNVTITEFQTTC